MRYTEFKLTPLSEAILNEVPMNPTTLNKWANSPASKGMLVGIEFEMIIPGLDNFSDDGEPDFSNDVSEIDTIEEVVDFFDEDGINDTDSLKERLNEEFSNWLIEYVVPEWLADNEDNYSDIISEYIKDNIDQGEVKDQLGFDNDLAPDEQEKVNDVISSMVDDFMNDKSSDEYIDALDNAHENMQEDFWNQVDYNDERKWFINSGMDSMQDIMHEYDLHWPRAERMISQDLEQLGESLSKYVGMEVDISTMYHGTEKRSDAWTIEPDESIEGDSGDAGLEIVGPPLPLLEGIRAISKLKAWAESVNAYTNKTTGLHINVSSPGSDSSTIDYVKLALFIGDKHVLETFGRLYNTYTVSAIDKIEHRINDKDKYDIAKLMDIMRTNLGKAAGNAVHAAVTSKFVSINVQEGRVEFRGPGGDWLNNDLSTITNTVIRLGMGLTIASDENLYKNEYAKKLYKLVTNIKPEEEGAITLFAQYQAGKISVDQLKKRWAYKVLDQVENTVPEWGAYEKSTGELVATYPNKSAAEVAYNEYRNSDQIGLTFKEIEASVPLKKVDAAKRFTDRA